MATFAFWALTPFVLFAAHLHAIKSLTPKQQHSVIRSARFWRIQ
jgi:hypothetical protein